MRPTKDPWCFWSRGRGRDEKNSRWSDSTKDLVVPSSSSSARWEQQTLPRGGPCINVTGQCMGTGGQQWWGGVISGLPIHILYHFPKLPRTKCPAAWRGEGWVGFLRTMAKQSPQITMCFQWWGGPRLSTFTLMLHHGPRAFDPWDQPFLESRIPLPLPTCSLSEPLGLPYLVLNPSSPQCFLHLCSPQSKSPRASGFL